MNSKEDFNFKTSAKSYIASLIIVISLMIFAYALTFFIPSMEFPRILDESGNQIIYFTKESSSAVSNLTFIKFIFSPILTLFSENGSLVILIIVFMLIIGGSMSSLTASNLINYLLNIIVNKFKNKRYLLLVYVSLFFMLLGAFIGSFEEVVPLVPICVALCNSLGFDTFTGLAISILSVGCGFSSGVCNPFTVGLAQKLAGLPLFSGIPFRLLSFVIIYLLLISFIMWHAKKHAKEVNNIEDIIYDNPNLKKALITFISIMGIGICVVLLSSLITILQDYTLIFVSLSFLLSGIICPLMLNRKIKEIGKSFLEGMKSIVPAVILIMMASSIRYILEEAKVMDTILYYLINLCGNVDRGILILLIYLIVLIMEIFVSSGSAKAFMIMPLIIPIAQVFGISSQLCILAYAFGDGFSNLIYPTNPCLLISLNLAETNYSSWIKTSLPFHLLTLLITSVILLLGLYIGY